MDISLGRRVIYEHGLISNVLAGLGIVDLVIVSKICRRTYQITVPWNVPTLNIPNDLPSEFPNIVIPSEDFVCKRVEATIEGVSGFFYGCVRKSTDTPDGDGVFVAGDWVHCGKVRDGEYTEGRKVSTNAK